MTDGRRGAAADQRRGPVIAPTPASGPESGDVPTAWRDVFPCRAARSGETGYGDIPRRWFPWQWQSAPSRGLGAVGFRWLITVFTRMFTGYDDYSGLGRVPSAHWPGLGVWFLLLAPVLAGVVYGPIVYRFAPEARGHGVPEVMYAIAHRAGRIAPQVTVVKALASALCIGGGGSVGREGPIVQIGSAAGSTLAQLLRLDTPRVRLLVACGAAGGISATFNAPLAGASSRWS